MKSTLNIIRTAASSALRQQASTTASATATASRGCTRAVSTTTRRVSNRSRKAAGGLLLAAPSFLLAPTESMIYDEDTDATQPASLSVKASLSTSNNLITSQDSLKDSFDAFLHSIEPLIHRRLSVGVSAIPHPAKVAKGGEDAYFLSADMKVIGVADGVGGWGDIGVDPALYSKSLMEGAKLAVDTPMFTRDPVEIMNEGYQYSAYVQGSSTACILVLDGTHINAANLGDSGFMIIRGLEVVYRSKEQQHSFNFPYQIGTGSADKPQHSQRIQIEVQPDDLILLGTDGLWDNLFDEDIIDIIANAPSDPATIAQLVARQAHIVANDKDIISPFSKSARSNGYPLATGGKLDDITVLCARVVLSYVDYTDLNPVEPMALAP